MNYRYCCYASCSSAVLDFRTNDLQEAIERCEHWRKGGFEFVTMAVQDPNCVGKMGVDEVDLATYDWTKRRDKMRRR